VLNIVAQDILKALIKNEADKHDNQAIRAIEEEEEQEVILSGKFTLS
jgi:CBS domain containing-hemolysin-like protein